MPTYDPWIVTNHKLDAPSLCQHRSVFTVSNGYFGLGGTVAEDRLSAAPLTIINGVYDEIDMFGTLRASNEERRWLDAEHFDSAGKSPAVANLPTPLLLQCLVNDRELTLTTGKVRDFVQRLDLRNGKYSYEFVYTDPRGASVRVEAARFASLTDPHRAFMRWQLQPLGEAVKLRIRSGVDATVRSNVTGERQFNVTGTAGGSHQSCVLTARTPAREIDVHIGVAHRGPEYSTSIRTVHEAERIYTEYELEAHPGNKVSLERFMVLASSEDARHGLTCGVEDELDAAADTGFDAALDRNRAQWDTLWQASDVQIGGDDRAQQYLRFSLFHLLAAGPHYAGSFSVPVKLLTGDFYQGNTFYDTDLYILPFYTLTQPQLARNFLTWRHGGLDEGRRIAARLGCQGAKLAWQAGPYGEECLGDWYRFTRTNIHITADTVFAALQYWQSTGDEQFMADAGNALLAEGARFYASRVSATPDRTGFDFHDVTGPNEGHVGTTNNFFTNFMAQQNLRWAADLFASKDGALTEPGIQTGVGEAECRTWRQVAGGISFYFDPNTLRYEQHAGFYQLKPIPQRYDRERDTWFETVYPYQALNQPDLVLAVALLPDAFPTDVKKANWDFYKNKSMDFSSMSYAPTAIVAARMGESERAYDNFIITAGMDLDEELTGRRDTAAGLHGTAAGGAWMAAVQGFGGVHVRRKCLTIDPKLPERWSRLSFGLIYRGARLTVEIDNHSVQVKHCGKAGPVSLTVLGQPVSLRPGQSSRIAHP